MNEAIELGMEESKRDEAHTDLRIVGTTAGGKDLVIVQHWTGYCKIQFTTGGQLPRTLSGRYTKYEFAVNAIKDYLADEEAVIRQEALKRAQQQADKEEKEAREKAIKEQEEKLLKEMEAKAKSKQRRNNKGSTDAENSTES